MARRSGLRTQSLQVHVRIKVPKGSTIGPKVIQGAIDDYIRTGVLHPAVEIDTITWHKEYTNGKAKDYEYDDPDQFLEILSAAQKAGILPKFFSPVLG